ncbi:hypothetical protein DVK85_06675 [Flavobacterium arcticum]|uniref:Uncharacterized protein n=1 Tax=Flavobacterium arcticum TaxID=1784713 RepID=A0A345HBI4_9FLAO|nr:hypothetical protein [Flavobacterium arcticum]AXG73944.1 hypothetical protein DVK85_06675 [Flavobacterium arcticum]KAF2508920.1 hypothetical protein E0W72_10160 [Flavobacterium arcticum]
MIKSILSGWKNYLAKSEVTEAVAKKRAALCAACPHAQQGKLLAFVKDTLKEVEGAYCNQCGCPLSAKVRSNDICPINKW